MHPNKEKEEFILGPAPITAGGTYDIDVFILSLFYFASLIPDNRESKSDVKSSLDDPAQREKTKRDKLKYSPAET